MDATIYTDFVKKYDLMYYRFILYKEILEKMEIKPEKILFSDLYDVIFQDDPFSIDFQTDLYCATEQNILSDLNNPSSFENRFWIYGAKDVTGFNDDFYLDKPVLCAGTILGTYKGIMKYLEFYEHIQGKKIVNDQGLYNIYIYNNAPSKTILEHKVSNILTLDRIIFENLDIDENTGYIKNKNGDIYAILHQINRCNHEFMKNIVDKNNNI
jgi:hypothetical protein